MGALRLIQATWRPLRSLVLLLAQPFLGLGRVGWRYLIVKPYGLALYYRRRFYQLFESTDLLDLLRRHQTVLFLVIAGAVLVTANSLKIQTATADDFGQHNLLFPLIQAQSNDTGTDTVDTAPPEVSNGPMNLSDEDGALLAPELPATLPGAAGRDRVEYYEVQSGDTLGSIAAHFNLQLTTILWENKLTARSLIRLGQKLTILPVDGVSYKVQKRDTVQKIASAFHVPADDISAFNQLEFLTPGQTIIIPGGSPLYVAPPPAPRPRPTTNPLSNYQPPNPNAPTAPASNSRLLWPTVHRRITQYYSWKHTGVDIADPIGTPIYAADDGVVVTAGWNRGGYGFYIIIDHGNGLQTLYGHTSKMYVKAGDHVQRGQQIADIGSTGHSTGPHVHFEVRVNGRRTNPLSYIR